MSTSGACAKRSSISRASPNTSAPSGESVTISQTRIRIGLRSVRWKFLVACFLIISIAFFAVGYSLIQLVGDYLFEQRVLDDRRKTDTFAQSITEAYHRADAGAMYAAASELCNADTNRILILDAYGVVQVDSASALNGSRFVNHEASQVLMGKTTSSYGYYTISAGSRSRLDSLLKTFIGRESTTGVFVSAIRGDTETCGAVVYICRIQEIVDSLRRIRLQITAWLLIVGISVLLLCAILIRTITRPIAGLKEGISRMAAGDFSVRVRVRGRNEYSELAIAFNTMCERLEALDRTRSQFVSNASHELKTPLSTMKILIESILYQSPPDPDMTKDFLTDVDKEIDRLSRIVTDLLTLANIDSGTMQLNTMELDIVLLVEEQVRRLAPLARENGIELDCLPTDDSIVLLGDPGKLEQVFYNVIDNAIKYTPRGGEVKAGLERTARSVIIRISDTGIGIPADDLPHVFDRFYRVDKARSRATGGTGLGLSIVKQIVQLHGGTITADSREGKGTTFTIELPTKPGK